jgi:transposase-like protein
VAIDTAFSWTCPDCQSNFADLLTAKAHTCPQRQQAQILSELQGIRELLQEIADKEPAE